MPMHALASNGACAIRRPGIARLGGLALWWATPVAFATLWWLASAQRWFPPQLVVPPGRLAATLRTLLDTGELRDNLLITLHRLALGFAIGATGGAAFGILLARSRLFSDYLRPTFDLLRQVPTLTLIPLLILLIGVDEPLKLVVVGKAVFFPVALAAYTGVHDAPRDLVEMAR
ncbi:ABC transporter permease, partial [Burkholderia cepacia]|uniref:ABC transporter permease n=1 Tax=Burkholderia cepacia TaxID=292 RepID=UPI0034A0C643|nr:ABC transporter permease [Burkholderia cepacia]